MALIDCPECRRQISDRAAACPHCGHPGPGAHALPVAGSRYGHYPGYNYESETKVLGLPLVHICGGADPATGKRRIARGIIAIGDIAIGALALGGLAIGGITLGGLSIGLAALGGAAFGVAGALGGAAISFGLSFGGLAIGYLAFGGGAFGAHACGGNYCDPAAVEMLKSFLGEGLARQLNL